VLDWPWVLGDFRVQTCGLWQSFKLDMAERKYEVVCGSMANKMKAKGDIRDRLTEVSELYCRLFVLI
jgi:hypothetical protein